MEDGNNKESLESLAKPTTRTGLFPLAKLEERWHEVNTSSVRTRSHCAWMVRTEDVFKEDCDRHESRFIAEVLQTAALRSTTDSVRWRRVMQLSLTEHYHAPFQMLDVVDKRRYYTNTNNIRDVPRRVMERLEARSYKCFIIEDIGSSGKLTYWLCATWWPLFSVFP